jgi:hypothetical protein
MLPPIEFDNAFFVEASKIRNIRADRMLAPKAMAVKLPPSYGTPQYAFDIGHIAA